MFFSTQDLLVVDGQQTLPPLESIAEIDPGNMSSILSTFDEACLAIDNSTAEEDGVVFVGAIAVCGPRHLVLHPFFIVSIQVNTQNECEVFCQKQILKKFQIQFAGSEYCANNR